jgi:uncharacterized protein (DUF342 family)
LEKNTLESITGVEIDDSGIQKNVFFKVNCAKLDQPLEIDLSNIIQFIEQTLKDYAIVYGIKNLPLIAEEIQKRLKTPPFKNFKVLIASGTPPIDGKNSEFKTFFQLDTAGQIDEKGNIDFKEKDFAIIVEKDTIIAEYIKPTKGIDGYDVFGSILKAQDGREIQLNAVKIDTAGIDRVEDDISIKFAAKKKGSLIQKNGIFHIEERVKIDKADIKTGNIYLKDVSDVNIGVSSDIEEDAIGPGIKVTGKKVVINGNVGPKAYVEADIVDIKGSVHQDATIKAKIARIKNLNGTLIAQEAFIENANYANIETDDKVTIDNCIACRIVSPFIEIKRVLNKNIIISSKEIILNDVTGTNNKILIKPLEIKEISKQYKQLILEEKQLSVKFKEAKDTFEMLKQKLDYNLKSYNELIELVKNLRSKNLKIPKTLLDSVNRVKEIQDNYQKQKELIINLGEDYKKVTRKSKALIKGYKTAYVLINGEIEPENIIEFGETLSKVLTNKLKNIKVYVDEIDNAEEIAIDNN